MIIYLQQKQFLETESKNDHKSKATKTVALLESVICETARQVLLIK